MTRLVWVVSRPLPIGLMQILKTNFNKKLGQFPPHDHIFFQGVPAIFFRTTGAESTCNFKKKLLLVFEVGSFWQFFRNFSSSPLMTPHVSFECWSVDKPIYNVLFQNLLFLPSKKIHNIWG
jgi:hypothetical protein